jgi:hypothetical protein
VSRLDTIPGVNKRTAEVLIAEIGVDMGVFPTAGHLASWAGLCPGNTESAGKHRSGRTRKGNRWLRGALIQAALAGGTRATKGALAARYRRVMGHRGHKKAVVAVAHAILVAAYHLLARQTTYHEPGADYYERRHAERVVYGLQFRHRVKGMGIEEVLTAPHSPWQNPFAERLIGSILRECLNHVVVLGERHLRRILTRYLACYHQARTHLALDKDAPDVRPIELPMAGKIVQLPEVGGLHRRYLRQAA